MGLECSRCRPVPVRGSESVAVPGDHPRTFDHAGRPVVDMTAPLRGREGDSAASPVGSLRHVASTVASVPNHQLAGGQIRETMIRHLDSRPWLAEKLTSSLGKPGTVSELVSDSDLRRLRSEIACLIESRCPQGGTIVDVPTWTQGHLLHRWALWAGDPAAHTALRSRCLHQLLWRGDGP